jgi:hypothetical protein
MIPAESIQQACMAMGHGGCTHPPTPCSCSASDSVAAPSSASLLCSRRPISSRWPSPRCSSYRWGHDETISVNACTISRLHRHGICRQGAQTRESRGRRAASLLSTDATAAPALCSFLISAGRPTELRAGILHSASPRSEKSCSSMRHPCISAGTSWSTTQSQIAKQSHGNACCDHGGGSYRLHDCAPGGRSLRVCSVAVCATAMATVEAARRSCTTQTTGPPCVTELGGSTEEPEGEPLIGGPPSHG